MQVVFRDFVLGLIFVFDSPSPPSAMSRPSLLKSRRVQLSLGLIFTVACLVWAMYSIKAGRPWPEVLAEIGAAFQQADYRTLPILWSILVVFYWLKALRWKLLLAPVGDFDATRDLLPPILAGFALNNVLPARVGELIRVLLFSRSRQVPAVTALASVAVERILDALTILILLGIGISRLNNVDPDVHRVLQSASLVVGGAVGCILIYLVWTKHFLRLAQWGVQRVPLLPAAIGEKVIGILQTGADGLAALKRGRLLGGIIATSFAQWVLNALYLIVALWAFDIPLPWDGALILMGVVAFGVAIPSVPGYFGVMQFWFLVVLRQILAVPAEEKIVAASIYYQLSQFIPVTLIGLVCANRLGFALSDADSGDAALPSREQVPEPDASN